MPTDNKYNLSNIQYVRYPDNCFEIKDNYTWPITVSEFPISTSIEKAKGSLKKEIDNRYLKEGIQMYRNKLPMKYYINKKKNTCCLLWNDDTRTIVKKSKDDKFDKRLAFLTAYFQKHCGMSKTKANEYLDNLEVIE